MKQIFLASILILSPPIAPAQDTARVTLQWDPNTETDLAGYTLYTCLPTPAPCSIEQHHALLDVGKIVKATPPGPVTEGTRFFVTASDLTGNQSGPSNTVTLGIPPNDPTGLTITITIRIQP